MTCDDDDKTDLHLNLIFQRRIILYYVMEMYKRWRKNTNYCAPPIKFRLINKEKVIKK